MSAVVSIDDWGGWALDAAADYAARGQKYRNLSDEDLSAAWVSSFKDVASDFTNPQLWSVQRDLTAEFGLRERLGENVFMKFASFLAKLNCEQN